MISSFAYQARFSISIFILNYYYYYYIPVVKVDFQVQIFLSTGAGFLFFQHLSFICTLPSSSQKIHCARWVNISQVLISETFVGIICHNLPTLSSVHCVYLVCWIFRVRIMILLSFESFSLFSAMLGVDFSLSNSSDWS